MKDVKEKVFNLKETFSAKLDILKKNQSTNGGGWECTVHTLCLVNSSTVCYK